MSSWRQTTKHIGCPAASHLPIHTPPVPEAATKPIYLSLLLSRFPAEIKQTASLSLSLYLSLFLFLYKTSSAVPQTASCLHCSLPSLSFCLSFYLSCISLSFPLSFLACLFLSAHYWELNSFTNFSCLWQPITQI